MKDIYQNWSFEEFLAFIMFYAAMADYNVTTEEKDLIIAAIGTDKFNQIKNFYLQNSDYDNIQAIYYFKNKYCSDPANLNKVFDSVSEIFDADGKYSFYEKNIKRALEMVLTQ